jgi:lysozyme family protein
MAEREEKEMSYQYDTAFMRLCPFILRLEGGYVNNTNDKGGETKYGISKASYPELDIKNLTEAQATEIYYTHYWLRSKADRIPDLKLALIHFDAAVQSGVSQSLRFLNRLPKSPFYYEANGKNKELWAYLFQHYFAQRQAFYDGRAHLDTNQRRFYPGWMNRLERIHLFAQQLDS